MEEPICPNGLNFHGKDKEEKTIPRGGPRSADFTEKTFEQPTYSRLIGGDAGIRTLDTGFGPYAPLAGECLRPLGHVSEARNCTGPRVLASMTGSPPRKTLQDRRTNADCIFSTDDARSVRGEVK